MTALVDRLDQAQVDALARLRIQLGQHEPAPAPESKPPPAAVCGECGRPLPPPAAIFRRP